MIRRIQTQFGRGLILTFIDNASEGCAKTALDIFMVNIIVIALMIIPWVVLPFSEIVDQFRLPKAMFFDAFCMAVIAYAFYCGQRFSYKNKYLAWLVVWVLFTFFMNWFLPFMITADGKRVLNLWSMEPMIHTFLAIMATYCAMVYLDGNNYLSIAKAICVSSTMISIFCIFQAIGLDPMQNIVRYKNYELNHVSAMLDHPNMVGNYMAMSLPFFALFLKDKKFIFMGLIVFVCLLVSKSSISIFAFGISSFMFAVLTHYKNWKILTISTACLIGFLSFVCLTPQFNKIQSGGTGRFEVWKITGKEIKNNPIFGRGIGIFKTLEIKTSMVKNDKGDNTPMKWNFVHNDWLERTLELGFFGLFLIILVVVNTFRNFDYNQDNLLGRCYLISFSSLLIIMCASFPMEFPPLAMLGMIGFWGAERL